MEFATHLGLFSDEGWLRYRDRASLSDLFEVDCHRILAVTSHLR